MGWVSSLRRSRTTEHSVTFTKFLYFFKRPDERRENSKIEKRMAIMDMFDPTLP